MSRQNKVNPGNYTQAGRLSQDDAAREMKKQRETASPGTTDGDHGEKPKSPVTDEDKSDDTEATGEQKE